MTALWNVSSNLTYNKNKTYMCLEPRVRKKNIKKRNHLQKTKKQILQIKLRTYTMKTNVFIIYGFPTKI